MPGSPEGDIALQVIYEGRNHRVHVVVDPLFFTSLIRSGPVAAAFLCRTDREGQSVSDRIDEAARIHVAPSSVDLITPDFRYVQNSFCS